LSGFYPLFERFEPIGSAGRVSGFLLLQRFPLAHQFGLFGREGFPINQLVQKRIQKLFEAQVDLFNIPTLLCG
jgi:hypothetical protein